MNITSDIFKKNARNNRTKSISLDLYGLSTELYNEFNNSNLIDRLKNIPQLGGISVSKSLCKSRYDYIILQWWLHKSAHDLVNSSLEYSYASRINQGDVTDFIPNNPKPTVEEFLQLFILVYNIGHFYATFISSKTMLLKLKKVPNVRTDFVNLFSGDADAMTLCNKIIDEQDYYHFHLLNSILVLNNCNQKLLSVKVSKRLIIEYLNGATSKKLNYLFRIFKSIRNLAITAFDLQLANVPFRINLQNETSLKIFLNEYLAQYNDNSKANNIVISLTKLLSDSLYNENVTAIKEYSRVLKTTRTLPDDFVTHYYNDYFINNTSVLNNPLKTYSRIDTQCLKLTFEKEEESVAVKLFERLQHMQFVRSTMYSRHYGQSTIVVSTSKSRIADKSVFYKIYKVIISALRSIKGIEACDLRYLLATKYFLRSVFDNRRMVINATSSSPICLFCLKGKLNRKKAIDTHLSNYLPAPDPIRHEVEHMLNVISSDTKNDTAILIPASILLFSKSEVETKTEIELDGLVIFPFRTSDQIIFLESKKSRDAGHAEKELKQKLEKMGIEVYATNMHYTNPDAHYTYSI